MNDQITIELRQKITKIISLYEQEKEKSRDFQEKSKEYQAKIDELKTENEKLTIRYNNLKLAKGIEASTLSNHDAKLKVNTIVREIDKCIALLNK